MRDILKELDEVNKTYILEEYKTNFMITVENEKRNNLSELQKYELDLNENNFPILDRQKLFKSIIDWPDINKYNISDKDLIEYFKNRSLMENITLDRKYFFHELILSFCRGKDKKIYAKDTFDLLKEVLQTRSKDNFKDSTFFILYLRFIIIKEIYNFGEDDFILDLNKEYIKNINPKLRFFYNSIAFFETFFGKYTKGKVAYYNDILNSFNIFTEIMSQEFLKTRPIFSEIIGDIYKKIEDNDKKEFFHKKTIDDFFKLFEDKTVKNRMIYQLTSFGNVMKLSKDIKYRFDELKELNKNNSKFLSENKDKIFTSQNDIESEELKVIFYKSLEDIKYKYEKVYVQIEDKIDYLCFRLFHSTFNSEKFEHHKNSKTEDQKFMEAFFGNLANMDFKGQLHTIKDKEFHSFFEIMVCFNNILLVLDYEKSFVKEIEGVILENIKSLKILEGYQEQYKIAIQHFSNENYIEFMYISPVLIENILKKYLIQIEGDSISYRNGKFTDKTLEQVIEKLLEDDKCCIDKTILKIISHILIDSDGMNLRNEILHANFSDDRFNKNNAMNIYIILIFLIRYFYSINEQ